MTPVSIQHITIGNKAPLVFIAGPCVIESRDHVLSMAEALARITEEVSVPLVFKSSYDKANRSSLHAYRGLGVERGIEILGEVKDQFSLPILTDVHETWQVEIAAEVVDVLQVPAFLSRQTDLILAAAESGRVVNIKKGQFLAPWDIRLVLEKVESTGNRQILITERGTSFGYNNLVADMRAIPLMQEFGYPVVFDATHSAQLPGGEGSHTGGLREYIPAVARAAVAAGANGIFMEVHDNVDRAKSDAATQWPLEKTRSLIQQLHHIYSVITEMEEL